MVVRINKQNGKYIKYLDSVVTTPNLQEAYLFHTSNDSTETITLEVKVSNNIVVDPKGDLVVLVTADGKYCTPDISIQTSDLNQALLLNPALVTAALSAQTKAVAHLRVIALKQSIQIVG